MDRRALAVLVSVLLAPVAGAHIEDARALSRLARTVTSSNAAATWIETAQLLARNAKWSAAADAQSRALEALAPMEQADARRDLATGHLLLARYRLHSGDPRGAEAAIDRAPPAARNSISAVLLRSEIAIARGDADAAAVLLESLNDRRSEAIDQVALPQLYCNTVPLQDVTVRSLLAAQVELLRGETETAISSLESLLREHSSLADAAVLLANALHESGRSDEALARLHAIDRSAIHAPANCPGILSDRVFFNAGNIARDAGDRNAAAELYRRAISVAEKREQELARLVRDRRLEMPPSVRTIVSSAILATGDAAPEARNNLGHLLLEMTAQSSDSLLLGEAEEALRAAAESPVYATPHFAHVGHAQAEIRRGNWKEAVSAIASALWIDPSYRNALELAASTTTGNAPSDAALAAGTVLISAMREASPQAFASSRQQELTARIAERAEHASSEAADHYLVSYDLYRGNLESAERRLDQARTSWSASIWPFARSGELFGAIGDDARALEMFRTMEKARTERAELSPLNAIAIRQSLGTYMTVAANHGAAAEAQFLAEAFGATGIARAQRIPWGPPVHVELVYTDSLGMPLPGTTITIHPTAGPPQQAVTGPDGTYTATLTRGSYTVTAELSGLAMHTETYYFSRENTRVETAMQTAIVENITVTSDPSMVLVEPGQSITVTAEQIESLPVRSLTFRVSDTLMNPVVYGSASAENFFMINGLNVTSPIETGSGWLGRSTASLAQIEITSVGRTADAPDAIVRTETTRGTNDVDVKIELGSHPGVDRADVAVPFERQRDHREWSAAASIGFPIIKDSFFLFARGERVEATGTGGTPVSIESTREKREGVANFTVTPTSMIDGRINLGVVDERRTGGLEDIARALFGSDSAVNRAATHRSGTAILSASVVHSPNAFTSARVSALHDETTFRPRTAAGERAQFRLTEQQLFAIGGVGFINDGRVFDRFGLAASVDISSRGFRWIHDLKGGFEYDEERDELHDRLSGGEMMEGLSPLGGETLVRFWTAGGARTSEIRETIESSPLALYVLDKFSFDRVTMNVGVRWSRQTIDFPEDARLSTAVLQPRLNVDYRHERWNLFVTYGRYAEHLGGDERAGAGSLRRFHVASNSEKDDPGKAYGGLLRVDPDLRGRYDDEISAGFSRLLGLHGTFRANAIRRRRRSDIQDFFCTGDLHRCIGNPGRGIMMSLRTLDGDLADTPRARRELDALDMSLRGATHLTDSALEIAGQLGYVWSRLVGNVQAPDLESTRIRGIDPYSRTAFDFKELVPEVGPLARHRRHTFTASGAATMKGLAAEGALKLSASAFWFSGEPRGRFGYSDLYGRYVHYLSDRGDEGRSPSAYDADAMLTYEWTLRGARVQLSATIENALDRQTSIIDDQRWNFREDMQVPNPTFLQPMERLGARTIWFTAKVQF